MKKCCAKNIIRLKCPKCDYSCGHDCIFFSDKKLTILQTIYARSRIMEYLYETGLRYYNHESASALIHKIKKNIHDACDKTKIDEPFFFPSKKFYVKELDE